MKVRNGKDITVKGIGGKEWKVLSVSQIAPRVGEMKIYFPYFLIKLLSDCQILGIAPECIYFNLLIIKMA